MALDLVFQGGGGAGGGASDFLVDAFQDFTVPASNNAGLSSTISSNPLGVFLGDNNTPKYRQKTLMIVGCAPVEDRSKWINASPTYELTFDQTYQAVRGYVTGSPRISKTPYGTALNLQFSGDVIGVNTKCVRMGWIIAPTTETGTARIFTDGTDTTRTATFGPTTPTLSGLGYNSNYTVWHQAADETSELHDFRLVANEFGTLNVIGVVLFFDDASGIVASPGSAYFGRAKISDTVGATLSVLANVNELGYRGTIFQNNTGYGVSINSIGGSLTSFATGTSGGTSVDVSVGHGASFPAGTGFIANQGTSTYIGTVVSVSTDNLTVTPALPIGLSATIFRAWRGGQSLSISPTAYQLIQSLDPQTLSDPGQFQTIGWGLTTSMFWQDRRGDVRITAQNVMLSANTTVPAFGNVGGTLGIIQIDGRFAAMGLELAASGFVSATFSINGIPSHSVSNGATGIIRRSVFTSGSGWKSVRIALGSSNLAAISKINLYGLNEGATLGVIAGFDSDMTSGVRYAPNATLMGVGAFRRFYGDQMFFQGPWDRQGSAGDAGGILYVGSTTTCSFTHRYIGSNYAFIGTQSGGSLSITRNGGAVGSTFGVFGTGVSMGFQSIVGSVLGATVRLSAIDVQTQGVRGEIEYKSPIRAIKEPEPTKVWNQSNTPVNAKDGDLWLKGDASQTAWLKGWGRWIKLNVQEVLDDPNASMMWITGGSTTAAASGGTGKVSAYNFAAWNTAQPEDSVTTSSAGQGGSVYQGKAVRAGGLDTASSRLSAVRVFNKVSWASGGSMATAKNESGSVQFFGLYYNICGNSGSASVVVQRATSVFAWSTATAASADRRNPTTGAINSTIYTANGRDAGAVDLTSVETRSSADAVASGTNTNVNISGAAPTSGSYSAAMMAYLGSGANQNRCQSYNGTAYSATSFTLTNSTSPAGSCGSFHDRSLIIGAGNQDSGGSAASTLTNTFNGIATGTAGALPLAIQGTSGGAI